MALGEITATFGDTGHEKDLPRAIRKQNAHVDSFFLGILPVAISQISSYQERVSCVSNDRLIKFKLSSYLSIFSTALATDQWNGIGWIMAVVFVVSLNCVGD